jgi:hypothetical protein
MDAMLQQNKTLNFKTLVIANVVWSYKYKYKGTLGGSVPGKWTMAKPEFACYMHVGQKFQSEAVCFTKTLCCVHASANKTSQTSEVKNQRGEARSFEPNYQAIIAMWQIEPWVSITPGSKHPS